MEQTIDVGAGQSVRYDDARVASAEVRRLWASLLTLGARLDPSSAASIYAAGKKEEVERPTPGIPRPPVNAESLKIVTPVFEWRYAELAGLELALQLARSIPALATRDPAAVVFGKVESLVTFKKRMADPGGGAKKFVEHYAASAGELDQAETGTPSKGPMSIVLAAGCKLAWPPQTTDGRLMDMVDDGISDRAQGMHEFDVRMLRMTWAHELGHTLYPRYKTEWEKLVTAEVKAKEGSPTGYAARKSSVEEDFCESFTVLALYPGFKDVLRPTRTRFFATHPELLRTNTPAGASSPAKAVTAGKV